MQSPKPARKFYLDLARPARVALYEVVSFGGALVFIRTLAKIPACKQYLFLIKD